MEDDKLKDIFSSFNPEVDSDTKFMSSLNRTLDAIDDVRAQSASLRSSRRVAIFIAGFVGFVFGVLATVFVPLISALSIDVNLLVINGVPIALPEVDAEVVGWVLAAVVITLLVINTYKITFYLLSRRHSKVRA